MIDFAILLGLFLLSFVLATVAIRLGIPAIQDARREDLYEREPEVLPESSLRRRVFDFASNGFWIGFFESLLVFVFAYEREYGALAIIVAAKEFVRREKIEREPSYYLLGTFINLTVALLFAIAARVIVRG